MSPILLKTAFFVQDLFVRPYVLQAISKLRATSEVTAQMVAESIGDAFSGSPSEHEATFITRIEERRTLMNSSNEVLDITDFGAGAQSPDGTLVQRTLGEVSLSSSKPKRWCLLLFYLIERLMPQRCLEFGTCVGISTLYQSAALTLNGHGTVVTMEGSQTLAAIAQQNFQALNCSNIISVVGTFNSVLPTVVEQYQPFDVVFIDGHHEGTATLNYFERLLPSLSRNAVVVFDDIHWSASMKNAWKHLINHRRVKYAVDLFQLGIVIVS
ncbi:MAG: class I SAM-dependent methyltransferase [Bacteroidota bacterium]